jgi:hypothetical protein
MELTKEQIEQFVAEEINSRNFLIFARLLNIRSNANYRKVIELLATRRINYFMLNDLRIIDDQSIANFLAEFETSANPEILFSATSGTFRPSDYLEGILGGAKPETTFVKNLIAKYNAAQNQDFTSERKFVNVKRPATTVGKRSFESYQTITELQNVFQEKVVLPTLKHYGVQNVREIFPMPSEYPVSAIEHAVSIRLKYESIFGDFIDQLDNDNLMSVFLTVNDSASFVERLAVEMNEIYNFQRYSRGIVDAHRYSLFEMASLGRAYNEEEIRIMEDTIHSFQFPTVKLSEHFSKLNYTCALVQLSYGYAGNPTYFDSFMVELDLLAAKIMKFKEFLDVVQGNIFNSIKLTNQTGN